MGLLCVISDSEHVRYLTDIWKKNKDSLTNWKADVFLEDLSKTPIIRTGFLCTRHGVPRHLTDGIRSQSLFNLPMMTSIAKVLLLILSWH